MTKYGKIAKRGIVLMFLLAITLSLFWVPEISALGEVKTTLGAHRGSSVLHIENTVEAFEAALEDDKYKFIELDIQYTKDKEIVVYHDLSLLRLQLKNVKISEVTYDELQEISEWKIPTYDEAMDLIGKTKKVNVEIKSQGNIEDDKKLVDWVIEDAKRRGILDTILLSSISSDVVLYISQTYPDMKVGKIHWITPCTYVRTDGFTQDLFEDAQKVGADFLMLHGVNVHNYPKLVELKPKTIGLAFWYFTDEMYIVHDGINVW